MPLTLREYRPSDFETLLQIDQECFAPGIAYSRRELAAYIQLRGAFTLVVEDISVKFAKNRAVGDRAHPGESILGFLVAHTNRRGLGHIITIDVRPNARRQKVGSRLLTAAEERLRAARCHSVVLETAVDNGSALAFYKRHHYSVLKTVPRYYSNGLDALVLEKALSAEKHLLSSTQAG